MRNRLITILLCWFATSALANPSIEEYTAVYALKRGSMKAGEATFVLKRNEDGTFLYESVTRATGLVALFRDDVITESSRLELVDGALRPVHYLYQHENTNKNRNQEIIFDWERQTAESNNRGAESELELESNSVDRASLPVILRYAILSDNMPRKYVMLDHGKRKNYKMEIEPGSVVKTKAGKFETVLATRRVGANDQQLRIWFATEKDYLPVRIENEDPGGEVTSLELLKIDYATSE